MKRITALAVCFAAVNLFAQEALNAKKLTVYNNGTALIINEGNAKIKNGNVMLPLPMQAIYGTYWVGGSKDNPIKQITFKNDTLKVAKHSENIANFLNGNKEKKATIYFLLGTETDKSLSGTIEDFYQPSGMLKFRTEKGVSWMSAKNIYQVEFKETESATYLADSVKKMVVIQPERNTATLALQEFYLRSAMNWIPSYFLKLKDEKIARLEMKALIENGGDAINNAETEVVVGAPQLAFGLSADPMTYDYVTGQNSTINYANAGGYTAKSARGEMMLAAAPTSSAFDQTFTTSGEKSGDLYFYKLGKISLDPKSKGSFPIFAKELEYKDKYECNIPDYVNFYSLRYLNEDEQKYDVFHSLEFKNNTEMPLTAASVMVLNDKEQFLAQDNMKYTPANASTSIRLSKAIDVVLKNQEEEITRNANFKKIGKKNYGKISIKGSITVENFQDANITLNITKNLTGEVTKQNENGKTIKRKSYYTSENPTSEIKWETSLRPNEKRTFTYEYEVLYAM